MWIVILMGFFPLSSSIAIKEWIVWHAEKEDGRFRMVLDGHLSPTVHSHWCKNWISLLSLFLSLCVRLCFCRFLCPSHTHTHTNARTHICAGPHKRREMLFSCLLSHWWVNTPYKILCMFTFLKGTLSNRTPPFVGVCILFNSSELSMQKISITLVNVYIDEYSKVHVRLARGQYDGI